jgi:hypothetical protein
MVDAKIILCTAWFSVVGHPRVAILVATGESRCAASRPFREN